MQHYDFLDFLMSDIIAVIIKPNPDVLIFFEALGAVMKRERRIR